MLVTNAMAYVGRGNAGGIGRLQPAWCGSNKFSTVSGRYTRTGKNVEHVATAPAAAGNALQRTRHQHRYGEVQVTNAVYVAKSSTPAILPRYAYRNPNA